MSVCCSVGYEGSNIAGGDEDFVPYDLSCPQLPRYGELNFWKIQCLRRIGNRELKCCNLGCKEAAKHPKLKEQMDLAKVLNEAYEKKKKHLEVLSDKSYNHIRYKKNMENARRNMRVPESKRADIISLYINGFTLAETVTHTGCNKSKVSMVRRMYREGALNVDGELLI